MNLIRRFFIVIIVFGAALFTLKGTMYRNIVQYKSVGERTSYAISDTVLLQFVAANAAHKSDTSVQAIIDQSLRLTKKLLHFTFAKNETNPNKLIATKSAHCVGYAAFFTATCNYLLAKQNLSQDWILEHHIGQLYLGRYNVNAYISSPFFKDHDFVIIRNKQTGELLAVDPTLYDYTRIKRVKLYYYTN